MFVHPQTLLVDKFAKKKFTNPKMIPNHNHTVIHKTMSSKTKITPYFTNISSLKSQSKKNLPTQMFELK